MVKQFGVNKFTVIFKINIVKLITKYPNVKNVFLSLNCYKKYFKLIKEIWEENASEFE